jgi:serine/threonine-protein kinase
MLVPVGAEQRAVIAPRLSLHPLPTAPEARVAPRFTTTCDVGETLAPPAPLDTTNRSSETPHSAMEGAVAATLPKARSRAILATGAVVIAVIGGALLTRQRSPPAPMPIPTDIAIAIASAAPSEPPPGARVSAELPAPSAAAAVAPSRVVQLVVIPSDASVEIDGVPVMVSDGVVEIRGPLGSAHRVRLLKKGMKEMPATAVFVTEVGAQPAKLELAPLAKTEPGPPGRGAKPRPAPSASASAEALPPKPKPGDDDIRRGHE